MLELIFSEEDYHDRGSNRQLVRNCVDLLTDMEGPGSMSSRGIDLINILFEHEANARSGQVGQLNIQNIAQALQTSRNQLSAPDGQIPDFFDPLELEALMQQFDAPLGSPFD